MEPPEYEIVQQPPIYAPKPKRKGYKYCFVPFCDNTSYESPEKTFFTVPSNAEIRKIWYDSATRPWYLNKTTYYCCEDHFDLHDDVKNIQYLQMGQQPKLKHHIIPHKFDCQVDHESKSTRKRIHIESFPKNYNKKKQNTSAEVEQQAPCTATSGAFEDVCLQQNQETPPANRRDIGIQRRVYARSKQVICKPQNQEIPTFTRDIGIQHRVYARSKGVMCKPISFSFVEMPTDSEEQFYSGVEEIGKPVAAPTNISTCSSIIDSTDHDDLMMKDQIKKETNEIEIEDEVIQMPFNALHE